jgi:hypothetical protein
MTDRDNSMTAARKTLGISRAAGGAKPAASSFALTGARAEKVKERARELRRNPTPAQAALWTEMSGSKLGALSFCGNRWWAARLSISPALALDRGADLARRRQCRSRRRAGQEAGRYRHPRAALCRSAVLGDIATVLKAISAEVNKPFDKRSARRAAATQAAPVSLKLPREH